jgi:hypothetical protein
MQEYLFLFSLTSTIGTAHGPRQPVIRDVQRDDGDVMVVSAFGATAKSFQLVLRITVSLLLQGALAGHRFRK